MLNLVTALKTEIRRLARKEVRANTATTRRAAAVHRRDIARLKRQLGNSEKRIGRLESQISEQANGAPVAETEDSGNRFSSRSVRAQRRRLKLSAAEYGQLIGVSGQTIYQWEQGKSRPRRAQFASLIAVRSIGRRAAMARLSARPAAAQKSAEPKRRRRRAKAK